MHTTPRTESASSLLGTLIGMMLVGAVVGTSKTTVVYGKSETPKLDTIDDMIKSMNQPDDDLPDDFGIGKVVLSEEDSVRMKYNEYVCAAVQHAQRYLLSNAHRFDRDSLRRRMEGGSLARNLRRIIESHVMRRNWDDRGMKDFMEAVNYEIFFQRKLPEIK